MRLGAVDVFHLRGHQEMRALGLSGNYCGLVLALDGHLDVAWLSRRLARAGADVPELRWRLRAGLAPSWRPAAALGIPLRLRPCEGEGEGRVAAHDAAMRAVSEALPQGHCWWIDVLRQPTRDHLVFRWFHPLTDAPGAARICAFLGGQGPAPPAAKRFASADRLLPDDRAERRRLARSYFRHVMRLARQPIVSPFAASGIGRPGPTRAARLLLDAQQTASFYRSLRERAQLSDTAVFVWAGTRLARRLLAARGVACDHYLVPVPVALDRRGERQRMFGNHLTMMMFQLAGADLVDKARAIRSLARQRRDLIRDKLDVAMIAAMALAQPLPAPIYNWASRRPFRGERSSLVVSNPGELCVERFAGREVVDAYTLPTTLVPPGFQLIATRHGGRLAIEVMFARGIATAEEVAGELPKLREDVLEGVTLGP